MTLHKHHKIPKHAGGTDDPSNIVLLSVEEHAEAHRLLYEMYGRKQDLCAWKGLSGQWSRLQVYNYLRTGVPHTEETKRKISMAKRGVKLSEDHKRKISDALTGHIQPESQKQKVAEKLAQTWRVIDPAGNEFLVTNLSQFARDRNLDQGNLVKVAQGRIKQSKGYRVEYVG